MNQTKNFPLLFNRLKISTSSQKRRPTNRVTLIRRKKVNQYISLMDSTARRRGGDLLEGLYRVIMRRNSVYVTFIIAGAFVGERAVNYGVHKLREHNNVGK